MNASREKYRHIPSLGICLSLVNVIVEPCVTIKHISMIGNQQSTGFPVSPTRSGVI